MRVCMAPAGRWEEENGGGGCGLGAEAWLPCLGLSAHGVLRGHVVHPAPPGRSPWGRWAQAGTWKGSFFQEPGSHLMSDRPQAQAEPGPALRSRTDGQGCALQGAAALQPVPPRPPLPGQQPLLFPGLRLLPWQRVPLLATARILERVSGPGTRGSSNCHTTSRRPAQAPPALPPASLVVRNLERQSGGSLDGAGPVGGAEGGGCWKLWAAPEPADA